MEKQERSKNKPKLALNWPGVIAALIREHRVAQGWTQEELAHRAGYDPGYINMLERGRRNPSVPTLIDICLAFGTRPSVFFAEVERRLEPAGG